jgi:hypothetical protein
MEHLQQRLADPKRKMAKTRQFDNAILTEAETELTIEASVGMLVESWNSIGQHQVIRAWDPVQPNEGESD